MRGKGLLTKRKSLVRRLAFDCEEKWSTEKQENNNQTGAKKKTVT